MEQIKTIYFGADHGGYQLKDELIQMVKSKHPNIKIIDCGTNDSTSVDYPIYAHKVCQEVQKDKNSVGCLVCGTGIGMSICANKHENIRCALCHSEYDAEMTRRHNNSNVIAFGARTTGNELAKSIFEKYLITEFEGGRHQRRVDMIEKIVKE